MDKNAIKKFAVWARRELIARVSQKAEQYGITEKGHGDIRADHVNGHLLSRTEQAQRQSLITRIEQAGKDGYEQVMEEVAYTWFNRFIALRFMEVNGYLPSRVRVFTDEQNAFNPQILAEAIHLELDGLDMEKVYAFKEKSDDEALFKYLLITQCNALSSILPGMFQKIADDTELLFPDNLLREGSVIEQMIALIPEEDWLDQVQIIGWLYQYYNTEPKDQVFANLKKNIKIGKHDIPAATQLFTPDWIVRYMVENSLGRLWVEGHPDDALQATWKYYLPEAEQEPQVQAQLAEIRKGYAQLKPEDIRCIDPCMGSGHILVYLFDVLVQIYEAYGYSTREAVRSIVENNLYGLDIDDRAAQLAYFAVMMKARQYDRRFFTRGIQPHVMAIQESNALEAFERLQGQLSMDTLCLETANQLIRTFHEAKEYGSILQVDIPGLESADRLMEQLRAVQGDFELMAWVERAEALLPVLAQQAVIMQRKYDVVVTNPPYMGSSGMGGKLGQFVKDFYPDSKSDLFAVFIERCGDMAKPNGYQAMITQHAWMFLSSFEKLRLKLLQKDSVNMAHLGARAFDEIGGEVVQTTSFVLRKSHVAGYKGTYCRLIEPTTQQGKEDMFLAGENHYTAQQDSFAKIPGSPVAYWASDEISYLFETQKSIRNYAEPRHGMSTGNNDLCLKLWHEVEVEKILFDADCLEAFDASSRKYIPYKKGGEYRLWYGNNDYVIAYDKKSRSEMGKLSGYRSSSTSYFFRPSINWSDVSSSYFGVRMSPKGFAFDGRGASLFCDEDIRLYLAGIMCSGIASYILDMLNPTLTYNIDNVASIPVVVSKTNKPIVEDMVSQCYGLAVADWDSYETSWDFQRHPLLQYYFSIHPAVPTGTERPLYEISKDIGPDHHIEISQCYPTHAKIRASYEAWRDACEQRFQQLKANEEELNRIFIDIYGLQDELTPEVADKDVTVHRVFDTKEDVPESMQGSAYVRTKRDEVVSLISYAVGCMFGRYSLDAPGLILAGKPFSEKFVYASVPLAGTDVTGASIFPADGDCYLRTNGGAVRCTFAPDRDGILPICDDDYFTDDIVGRFVRFIEVVYGEDTLEENLKFIADALGGPSRASGKGTPREVIRSYFLNDFYADHCKTYQKRPIYWLFDSGKKNGFKCLIYMHRYAPDTIARIRTDYVHEQQSRYRTAIADLENRVASASTAERVKLQKQLAKLRDQAEETRVYEEKIHHYADQMIAIDLDDGVKVNYAKFQDVLGKIK